ncbi:MAG TPA: minichromosome maintenance protein MCM [Candidatus Syntrophoarchaeum butanivorans]|uniref:DNA helicase n=1 Tax=Candidatus Syntropharchaeum butanivorans TaxID=1839936 RepID=A0A1F2P5M8_9EURY|nr:MAG: replicative DNA helicase Mcm [Candidatus Syntrophoarchaeum butanivorans]HDM35785.1 minichromosome maintenance protein MCM [Candidatus Syntrophoarchaeum butanivorans]HEC57673.1 minichromosome maintenance protein MCM [Candidatus Syntrophoarchaeum butanivorans]
MEDAGVERWMDFLRRYYPDEVRELSVRYPDEKSLYVEFEDIERFDPALASELLENPSELLREAEIALRRSDLSARGEMPEAHLRVIKLPKRVPIRAIRGHHINRLIAVDGLVRKVAEVRPKVRVALFECVKCHTINRVIQKGMVFKEPSVCGEGAEDEGCKSSGKIFRFLKDASTYIDSQKIRIQEYPENLRGGEQPQTLDIEVEDDIAGITMPGDRIVINGILRSYQRRSESGRRSPIFDIYLEGISIELEEQEFEELKITKEDEEKIMELKNDPQIYEKIINSIAPSIFGYENIKEAMALQLFSGVPKELPDGGRIRGDIHTLVVGDPGIAKSQLLRYAAKLAPRGIYTSGKSTTTAGLTATAVRDEFGDGKWTLEAGALVLADKGLAAVDEIDKMEKKDQSALHEAMEQQTVSVAKAGIMATLKSRCALLGAANPKYGRFDRYEPISVQIDMSPTLLSRFDLIFTLTDEPDEARDSQIAEHILRSHYAGEIRARGEDGEDDALRVNMPAIPPDLLRKYIAYSRRNIFPVMTKEAQEEFKRFYVGLRAEGIGPDAPVPVTARQLEALVRLGEASARMRLSEEVTVEDARRIIKIVKESLSQVGVDPETGRLDADWIAVGTTKTRRDRAKILREIVRRLIKEHGGNACPLEEVYELAEAEGIEREKAEEMIEELLRDGTFFSPKHGMIGLP